jgi:molecular chaperone DnaJ
MAKDYYDILGVSESATPDEIKKTFRRLAKQYHPDRNKGNDKAEARFKELSEAYETLSDKKKRSEYDMMRKYGAFTGNQGGFHGPGPGAGGFPGGSFDFSDMFRQRGGRTGFHANSAEFGGFDDILSSIFGGGLGGMAGGPQQRRPRGQQRGSDLQTTVSISFMESVTGTTRVVQTRERGPKLSVKIPAGIEHGAKIRLAGQGQMGNYGGPKGDLIITVNVMPDQNFRRKGNDVYTTLDISFKEAILGCKKEVKTLSRTVSLTVPPGTQPGTTMRLKGMGLAVGEKTGDQYVEISVTIPKTLSEEQKKLLEQWGD